MNKKLLALALFLSAANAQAEFVTGNELLTDCKAERGSCYGFLMGVVDAHDTWTEWGDLKRQICIPAHVTGGQLRLIVMKYMESSPQLLHLSASSFVTNAIRLSFPCN